METYVTTHYDPVHFDHLKLFDYTAQDFLDSYNKAIRRVIPSMRYLCESYNSSVVSDEQAMAMRYTNTYRDPPLAPSELSDPVIEKGWPLVVIVFVVVLAIGYLSYKAGQAIDRIGAPDPAVADGIQQQNDELRRRNNEIERQNELLRQRNQELVAQGDRLNEFLDINGEIVIQNEELREQNRRIREHNQAMETLLKKIVDHVIVLEDDVAAMKADIGRIDEASRFIYCSRLFSCLVFILGICFRAHAINDFNRFLEESAIATMKGVAYAAQNHYWLYFQRLPPELQQQV
jgi:cell division protein FtsB